MAVGSAWRSSARSSPSPADVTPALSLGHIPQRLVLLAHPDGACDHDRTHRIWHEDCSRGPVEVVLTTDAEVRASLTQSSGGGWRWGLVLVAVLGLAGGAWALWPRSANSSDTWETRPIARGDLSLTVTAVGKLRPVDEVSISSELSGIVRHVYVDANDPVTAGQVLAELDTAILEAQRRQTHAQVDAADATAQQALVNVRATKTDFDRAQELFASGASSQAALDQASTAHQVAVANLALAEAQLRQSRAADHAARTNLEKARILAPIDGVVLERNVEPGQAVVSSLQAATLFTVARDLSKMTVEVDIDEADVGRIEPGQEADFTVAAFTDRVFDARVENVDLAPSSSTGVVTYKADLRVDNPDLELRPGMTATAAIRTQTYEDVLLVPNAALRFEPAGANLDAPEPREGRRVGRVFLSTGGEPHAVEVMPVATDGRRTAIEEGPLTEGEALVTGQVENRR